MPSTSSKSEIAACPPSPIADNSSALPPPIPGHLFGSPQDPISQICVGQGMTQAEYMNFRTLGKHRDTLKKKKSPVVSHLQHALMYLILSLNLSY